MAHRADTPRGLVDAAVAGRLDIPEFQRGFVWLPEKVKNLLDSLCRNYPLGSILCWRSDDYKAARNVDSTETDRLWIVDGQQRTTAMCLLLGKKPFWFPSPEPWAVLYKRCDVHVDLSSTAEDFKLSLPNPVIASSSQWMSVRELVAIKEHEIPAVCVKLLVRLGKSPQDTDELTRLMALVALLHAAMTREVIVIETSHDPVDVAEIFARHNSAGTRVNEGDVALALLAVRQRGWVKDELLPYLDDLSDEGFAFDPSFVIRTMAALRRGSGRLKQIPREFWQAGPDFQSGWKRTKAAIGNVLRVLRELGIISSTILPGHNALVPLFALDDAHAHGDAKRLRRAFKWMLAAFQMGRYSGSAITAMDQDLAAIREAPSFDKALEALEARVPGSLRFETADMLRRYDEDDFLKLMLYLVVYENGAEDWCTGQKLGFDRTSNALNEGVRPEWHHFVPRGRLRRRAPAPPAEELVNSLANIAVLGEGDNRRFSYSEPHAYLAKHKVPDARVRQQFFPQDRDLWTSQKFEALVEERSQLLAKAMSEYVARL